MPVDRVEENPEYRALDLRIMRCYRADGPFMVLPPELLARLYTRLGIDPMTLDPRLVLFESQAHFLHEGIAELFERLGVTAYSQVLSLGEGSGAPSRVLAKLHGCRIVGVDLNPAQVRVARACARMHGIEKLTRYLVQDVHTLALNGEVFTHAYANETICHWRDPAEVFGRIAAHLRSSAPLGLNVWLAGDRGTLVDAADRVPAFRELYEPNVWFIRSLLDFEPLLADAGFDVEVMEDKTESVDARLRLACESIPAGADAPLFARRGRHYYSTMLAMHGDYLRYGTVMARRRPKPAADKRAVAL